MQLRVRIALGFAAVAIGTAAIVALASPQIVSQGFTELESELDAADASPSPSLAALAPARTPAAVATERVLEEPEAETSGTGTELPEPASEASENADPETGAGAEQVSAGTTAEPGSDAAGATPESEAASGDVDADETAVSRPAATPHAVALPLPVASPLALSSSAPAPVDTTATQPPSSPDVPAVAARASPAPQGTAEEAGNEAESSAESSAAAVSSAREAEAREQVQQGTVARLAIVAILAAILASLLGLLAAGRLTEPVRRLEAAAQAVAQGELWRRSGLADRHDEFGQLGRSFDRMASELEEAEQNRRRFLQDAVHELRTPLTVIDATATAILDGVYAPDRSHLETIREQSQLLSRIVDDLRTISLAEVGQLPLRIESVAVDEALAAAVRSFHPRAAERNVHLAPRIEGSLDVTADPDRLRQMVGALVDNAIRHSPAGGEVRIVASPVSPGTGSENGGTGAVRFTVEDDGAGIPDDELPRIFDRFYQGNPAPNRPTGTSGLGLSIVQALAEAQGGRVGAENQAGGGARLWFELPT